MTTGKHRQHRKASPGASATLLPEYPEYRGVSSPALMALPWTSLFPEQNLVFHTITNKVKITQYTPNKKCLTNLLAPQLTERPFLSGELETQATIIPRSPTTHPKDTLGDRHQRYILQQGESRRNNPTES